MAAASQELTFAFDENCAGLLKVLNAARADPVNRITDLPSIGVPRGTLDAELIKNLGERGRFALVVRDGKMLGPIVQRRAWKASRVTLFMLSAQWGQFPLSELSRRLLFLWPTLVAHATDGEQGAAWRVNPTIPLPGANAFRLVTGQHAEA